MTKPFRRGRIMLAAVAVMLFPLAAMAQEQFQKVQGKVGEEIPAVPFVTLAYGFIWAAVLGYLVHVARSLARVKTEVEQLRSKLDRSTRGPTNRPPGRP